MKMVGNAKKILFSRLNWIQTAFSCRMINTQNLILLTYFCARMCTICCGKCSNWRRPGGCRFNSTTENITTCVSRNKTEKGNAFCGASSRWFLLRATRGLAVLYRWTVLINLSPKLVGKCLCDNSVHKFQEKCRLTGQHQPNIDSQSSAEIHRRKLY